VEAPVVEKLRKSATPSAIAVELDGTLVKTNLLLELLLGLIRQKPSLLFFLPFWSLRGKGHLKRQLDLRVLLDPATLPFRTGLIEYIRAERAEGRATILAADADPLLARRVASHLAIFDGVLDRAAIAELGLEWIEHKQRVFKSAGKGAADCLRALRLRHWLKNFLLFVPLLAAHRMTETALLGKLLLAFVAFGCITSSGYLINDLLDLAADRRHPGKRLRPFAAGDLPLSYGLAAIPVLIAAACAIGHLVSGLFLASIFVYLALGLAYSLYLKKVVLLDVIALAGLYTIRILAGSAAVAIWPSHWLLAFSTFLFFSLALVKRYGELEVMRRVDGDTARARAYRLSDRNLLAAMGIASGYLAVLVLALYINGDAAQILYKRYELMWLLCPLLLYWISHFWLTAHRGEMPDDPLVFAVSDRISRIAILLMVAVSVLAI
jgi:4-hydroxybenzoate polyprenyltransferase